MSELSALEYFNNELKEQMDKFTATFNQKIDQGKDELVLNKDKHLKAVNDLTQQQNEIAGQIETLNKKFLNLEKQNEEELKDLEQAKAKNDELLEQKHQYEELKQDLEQKIAALNTQIETKRQELNNVGSTLAENKKLNLIEMQKWERYLSLKIEGLKDDFLKISFTNVDVNDYNRVYWFILDITSHDFRIVETEPKLPDDQVATLESKFNKNRDLGKFLKDVRLAFINV